MYKYMLSKDDTWGKYQTAYEVATADILKKDPQDIAECAGVDYDSEQKTFSFESFGQKIAVKLPECHVYFQKTGEIPALEWRIMALHYLGHADGAALGDGLAHFRQMPGGNAYESAFDRRSINMLVSQICIRPVEEIKKVCQGLGGTLEKGSADIQAVFRLMPNFPVTVQIWVTDEEMEGAANVLFNEKARHYLPTEDIAVSASLLARFMMKHYSLMFSS